MKICPAARTSSPVKKCYLISLIRFAPVVPLLLAVLAPSFVRAGYWWRNVPVFGGGYVTGVIYNQTTGDLYLRSNVGGAWRFDSITREWVPLLDYIGQVNPNFYYAYVLSLATDPVQPENLYVAVGGYLNYSGDGAILASTDYGITWTQYPQNFVIGANDNGSPTGERLQVDPSDDSILYFASQQNGLWQYSNLASPPTQLGVGVLPGTLNFIRVAPGGATFGNPSQLLIVGAHATGANLFISQNGGVNWAAIPAPSGSPYYPMRCALAGNLLYVSFSTDDSTAPENATAGSVWSYDIAAGKWTTASPLLSSAYGFGGVCVDPEHTNIVMAATMDDYSPRNEIYRSTNSGSAWEGILQSATIDGSKAPYTEANFTHENWISDVEINPVNTNEAIFVTGYGVYMTENLTQADSGSTPAWSFNDQGFEETVVLGLASPPSGPYLLTALADVAGFRYDNFNTSPSKGNYSPFFPSSSSIDFAELDPSIVARSHTRDYVGDSGPRGSYSTDGGQTWTRFPTEPSGAADSGVLAVAADGSAIVWTPAGEGPYYSVNTNAGTYYSTDFGTAWTASSGLTDDLEPVADRVNPQKFYAYDTVNGIVYVSIDEGKTFTKTVSGLPTFPSYEDFGPLLKAVFGHEGNLWLAVGPGGLWRSTNSGGAFAHVTSVQSALQVGFGMAAPTNTYPAVFIVGTVGGIYGFYRSDDEGTNWIRINDDQHQFGDIYCLTGDERMYGRVYVGTGGRGAVYGNLQGPLPEPLEIERFLNPGLPHYQLSLPSEPGFDYVFQQSASLGSSSSFSSSGTWTGLATNAGTGSVLTYSNNILPGAQSQFFRVKVQSPQ